MKIRTHQVRTVLFGAVALAGGLLAATAPAQAQRMKIVNGQAYWEGDPGPVSPDPYFTNGQEKYDPNGYLDRVNRESQQLFDFTVYAQHAGKERCVWRKRVVNSNWEYLHPYIRVCRP